MNKYGQEYEYRDFVQRIFAYLFGPTDCLRLSTLSYTPVEKDGQTIYEDHMQNISQPDLDAALSWLIASEKTPNLYFGASAFDGTYFYTKKNCLHTSALFLDLDYGKEGHKKRSPFDRYDDALSYLVTLPIRPTCAWHTGHGIQAFFKLSEPYLFELGGGAKGSLARFEDVNRRLGQMTLSDAVFTPEHLFRVPLSFNAKPGTQTVRGTVLWFDSTRVYEFNAIELMLDRYGVLNQAIPPEGTMAMENDSDDSDDSDDGDLKTGPYEDLPKDIRDDIDAHHAERSDSMFTIVGRLLRLGYSDAVILDAVARGPDFKAKYENRLHEQIQVCIGKIRKGTYSVYRSYQPAPIELKNIPIDVPLNNCAPLPKNIQDNLYTYAQSEDFPLSEKVLKAAQFHEHLFSSYRTGVIESGCGCGKSTWAKAHIATHAGDSNHYMFVVETVKTLYEAAEQIERLTNTPVGRVHGYNPEKCIELCKATHSWRECSPSNKKSVCQNCPIRTSCAFFNRADEERKPIVVMTHSGFIRLLESGSKLLDDASILIDESLNRFITQEFSIPDLRSLKRYGQRVDPDIGRLFPYSSLSHENTLRSWNLTGNTDTFAHRHFVFRNEDETADIRDVYDQLRKLAGLKLERPSVFKQSDIEKHQRAWDVLMQLLNVFRPSAAKDAIYAYREVPDPDNPGSTKFIVKKSRFRLDSDRPYRKLWILDASAQLSPAPYPENMTVYRCPELGTSGELVTLHVVSGNPMGTHRDENIAISGVIQCLSPHMKKHDKVFIAVNKSEAGLTCVQEQLRDARPGLAPELVILSRGRIKGSNEAGECTLAYLTSVSLFTSVDDCALHAALAMRRTIPDRPLIFNEQGSPNMPGGRFVLPSMRNYYALSCLDLLYQAAWRTAVRNGKPVEVIAAIPDPVWLTALWSTVMPGFTMGLAYKSCEQTDEEKASYMDELRILHETGQIDADKRAALTAQPLLCFKQDSVMQGMQIVNAPAGTRVRKAKSSGDTELSMAVQLGYTGEGGWKNNKKRIMDLIGDFYEGDPHNNRYLIRKA